MSVVVERVLVVEDDKALADIVVRYLTRAGYESTAVHDGRTAIERVRSTSPDLVVLDLMLPGVDGWDVCRILRAETDVPIVMATARSTEDDTLLGLDLGADDYLTKPFSPRELVARVRTVLRRAGGSRDGAAECFEVGALVVDQRRHRVLVDGAEVAVTPKEFALLAVLAAHPDRAFTRGELTVEAFGWTHEGSSRTLDVHVLNLRRKLGDSTEHPRFIETVYGVGYRMVEPPAPGAGAP